MSSMSSNSRGKLDDTLAAMFSNQEYANDYLFYAHMLGQCSIRVDKTIKSVCGVMFSIDHYNLYVNPDLYDVLPLVQRLGILKHEMLHILYGHVKRSKGLDHEKFNKATDTAINQHIKRTHLPEFGYFPDVLAEELNLKKSKVLKNESSEYYYNLIKENESESSDGVKTKGEVLDDHALWEESTGDEELQSDVTKNMIERAQNDTRKTNGSVPGECSEWLKLVTRKSQVQWRKILRGIVGNKKINSRSTIQRRDRRFPKREDLRGRVKDRTFGLLVVCDVSGSMSSAEITEAVQEVKHICDVTKTDLSLIQIDTEAHSPEKIQKKTKMFARKAHGGTELSGAIEMAKKHSLDYQACVVITDGYISNSDIESFNSLKKRVIWLISSTGQTNKAMYSRRSKCFQLSANTKG